ncbi:hypothetical protein HDV06_003883 [Boothiomyces sp. JEL0866]|nr:hypothetical protein HDV06_003883 [Boothiomyces sp. JEL0866]
MQSNNFISAIAIGISFTILLLETIYHSRKLNGKLAPTAIVIQLALCTARALTLVIQLGVPNIQCVILGNVGMGIFAFWVTALDSILLLRSSVFITFIAGDFVKKVFIAICSAEMAFSLLNQLYVASTAYNSNMNAPYCSVNANFGPELYTLINRCVLYTLFSIPFAYKAYESITSQIIPKEEARMWTRMSITNTICTVLIIALELISAKASQVSFMQPWLELFFAMNNFCEANIVLLILDDTKKQLVRTTTSKSNPSSHFVERKETKSYNSMKYTHSPAVF